MAAAGAWILLNMRCGEVKHWGIEVKLERMGRILKWYSGQVITMLKEFELSPRCGYVVEWQHLSTGTPEPVPLDVTAMIRVCNAAKQDKTLQTSLSKLRVCKYRDFKRSSEKIRMPEDWKLSEK